MIALRRSLAPLLIALLALVLAGNASAADKFRYNVSLQTVAFSGSTSGSIDVNGLDKTKTVTIRTVRGGVQQSAVSYAAGSDHASASAPTLLIGDQIEVQQPSATVQETFTIPAASLTGTPGSPVLTGHAPDGSIVTASYRESCSYWDPDDFTTTTVGGAFSLSFPKALNPGDSLLLAVYPGKGDRIRYSDALPGETPCLIAEAAQYPTRLGATPSPAPFEIRANSLKPLVATGARIVLRRAGAAIIDYSEPAATTSISKSSTTQPLPGDTVELYRPHTAGSPSATFLIPPIGAVYDPGNALLAIDAPAAGHLIANAGSVYAQYSDSRGATNTPGGRTILDFAAAQGDYPAGNLLDVDFVSTTWYSPNGLRSYELLAAKGDLTAPVLKLKLASKFKISKLGSSVPVTITSSEAASATLALTLPAKLKTSAAKKTKKPTVVATAKLTLKAGTAKYKLKLTKAGKKLLKKIRSQHLPTQTATLTVSATDASHNTSIKTKTTRLAGK